MTDPTAEEMREFLETQYSDQRSCVTDFDIEAAIYWFANDHHAGQSSSLYSALSCSDYTPGRMMSGVESEGEMVVMLYQTLVREYSGGN